ncbi:AAA family ATPase (plasmid) [Cupriavidus pinatubonensis]|uniref:UvrD-helicase domain-containing protein n=1 Tax=Cupriavidus pinatubonensis TaxID=248026 RepID=UPI001C73B983|nr:UvrD-helicase domain-containing protein [Cupriavidus pinatubonensis]QYY33652.1 AAA family ATPase [Cupriavidus pinatubonensis]
MPFVLPAVKSPSTSEGEQRRPAPAPSPRSFSFFARPPADAPANVGEQVAREARPAQAQQPAPQPATRPAAAAPSHFSFGAPRTVAAPANGAPAAPQQTRPSASSGAPATQRATSPARPSVPTTGFSFGSTSLRPVAQAARIYTDQQRAIIEARADIVVAEAYAGTGKTTTAVGFTEARPDLRTLYLAFNRANAKAAQGRFPRHVTSMTTHALAYSVLSRDQRSRVENLWKPATIRRDMEAIGLNVRYREAAITQRILASFFASRDAEPSTAHAEEARKVLNAQDFTVEQCTRYAGRVWAAMKDKGGQITIPHDAYLKMFVQSQPNLGYQMLVFDEAQDANPITAQLVEMQRAFGTKLLYLGDRHQSIYAFRGATNAMEGLPDNATVLPLTQSWRFGPKTAGIANLILSELKGETNQIEGLGSDAPWREGAPYALLSRTNAELIKQAVARRGRGVHWVGGIEGYKVHILEDAWRLRSNQRTDIREPFIRENFSSWQEFEDYGDEAKDPEVKIIVELVDQYRHEIPQLVAELRANEEKFDKFADLVVATGHKAKGLEWDQVKLADDFTVLEKAEQSMADLGRADAQVAMREDGTDQELNLLYVAVTRAMKSCQLNSETLAWIADLPGHRQRRDEADMRLLAAARQHMGAEVARVRREVLEVTENAFMHLTPPRF